MLPRKPRPAAAVELVAVRGSDVVGLIDIAVEGEQATIDSIAVLPEHRRAGLASALLERAVAELREREVTRLEAWTRDDEAANAWYARSGFAEGMRYLHVYAGDAEEARRALTSEPGMVAVRALLHVVDMEREAELRARFARVHVCRCWERAV